MSSLIEHAKAYHAVGLVPIPIRQGKPLVAWQSYISWFPEEWDEIERLPWAAADGIALVLGHGAPGASYWWVLDIEAEHVTEAEAWLDQHVPDWRDGPVAESQSGGLHLYARSPQPVRTRKCPWGDIKGRAGLIYAPPTRRFKAAAIQDYRWRTAPLRVDDYLCQAPLLDPDGAATGAATQAATTNGHQPSGRLDVAQVLAGVPYGARNSVLFRLTAKLRSANVPEEWALRLVGEAAQRCDPPWGSLPEDRESVEDLVRRVYHRYPAGPTLVLPPVTASLSLKDSDRDDDRPVTASLPLSDSDDGQPETLLAVWQAAEPGPRRWVVPDLLPDGPGLVTTWFGDDGVGKSLLALTLASVVAAGGDFLGRPVGRTGPVLYVDTEFAGEEFVRRAYAVARGLGLARPPEGLWYYRTTDSLVSPAEAGRLARLVDRLRPVLVVVDSITLGTWDADLKEAGSVVALLATLERLPAPVLVLDHIPKPLPGQSLAYARPWGSFAKRAKARHAVLIVAAEDAAPAPAAAEASLASSPGATEGAVVLRVVKSNLCRPGTAVGAVVTMTATAEGPVLRVQATGLSDDRLADVAWHLPPLDQVAQALVRLSATAGAATPEELAEATGLAVGTVKNKLTVLRRLGRAQPVGGGRWVAAPSSLSLSLSDSDSDDDGEAASSPSLALSDGDRDDAAPAPVPSAPVAAHDTTSSSSTAGGSPGGPGGGEPATVAAGDAPSSLSLPLSDSDSDDGRLGGGLATVDRSRVLALAKLTGYPRYFSRTNWTWYQGSEGWRVLTQVASDAAVAEAWDWLLAHHPTPPSTGPDEEGEREEFPL